MALIWTSLVLLITVTVMLYGFARMIEERQQAEVLAGNTYQVYRLGDTGLVAEFDTDWEAEAYVDEHYLENLYISYPEERFEAHLKAIRQQ